MNLDSLIRSVLEIVLDGMAVIFFIGMFYYVIFQGRFAGIIEVFGTVLCG